MSLASTSLSTSPRLHRSPFGLAAVLVIADVGLALPSAQAAEPPGPVLDAGDLHDDRIQVPMEVAVPSPAVRQGPRTVFVNFDGAQLNNGENATNNQSFVCQGSFPAWGNNDSLKQATLQALGTDWDRFDIRFVTTRPSGSYDMIMAGDGRSLCGYSGGVGGVAPMDCGDDQSNNVVFSFGDAGGPGANGQATIMSQELAHAYGLEHVNHTPEIMHPSYNGSDQSFIDNCYSIVDQSCNSHPGCSSGQQNSVTEMMELLGPSAPDQGPPQVQITAPTPGQIFAEGANFNITANASDDRGVTRVVLLSGGTEMGADSSSPYGWGVMNIPAGVYDFQARAEDAAGNESLSAIVTITVEGAPGGTVTSTTGTSTTTGGTSTTTGGPGTSTTTGAGTSTTTGPGTSTTTTGTSGTTGTSATGSSGGDDDDSGDDGDPWNPPEEMSDDSPGARGCACHAGERPGGGAASLAFAVALLGLGRRTRIRRR